VKTTGKQAADIIIARKLQDQADRIEELEDIIRRLCEAAEFDVNAWLEQEGEK